MIFIVLPTRNRAQLAIRAAHSCGDAPLLVSDNSSDAGERAVLAAYCAGAGIELIRPPRELAMGDHWEWACAQAVARAPDAQLLVMTDRMVWKRDGLGKLARAVAATPDRIVTFLHDAVRDDVRPLRVQLSPWAGDMAELESRRFLELAARGRRHSSMPRLLNCAVPPRVIRAVRARFGDLCVGQAPDYAFGFRALALEPTIVHIDAALQICHGMDRSNGASHARGLATSDAADYLRHILPGEVASASPVPGLLSPLNVITHEYNRVRRLAPDLPELSLPDVLDALAREAHDMVSPETRATALERLRAAGWRPGAPARRLVTRVRHTAAFRRPVTGVRRAITWAVRMLHSRTGIAIIDARQLVFDDLEDALRAVENWPRPPGAPAGPPAIRRWRAM